MYYCSFPITFKDACNCRQFERNLGCFLGYGGAGRPRFARGLWTRADCAALLAPFGNFEHRRLAVHQRPISAFPRRRFFAGASALLLSVWHPRYVMCSINATNFIQSRVVFNSNLMRDRTLVGSRVFTNPSPQLQTVWPPLASATALACSMRMYGWLVWISIWSQTTTKFATRQTQSDSSERHGRRQHRCGTKRVHEPVAAVLQCCLIAGLTL
jgi:hypothetical protein